MGKKLLTTLSTMGPSYKISFELFINSFTGVNLQHERYAEVLRFTCTNLDCCSPGDRIPLIMTHKDSGDTGRITVATQIGDNANYCGLWNINRRSWTSVAIEQYQQNGKVTMAMQCICLYRLLENYIVYFSISMR